MVLIDGGQSPVCVNGSVMRWDRFVLAVLAATSLSDDRASGLLVPST